MPVVTMKEMLESGVHFGHQTRRWNPKMKRFILTERNGLYIIDLHQTLTYVDKAYEFIKETVAHGGTVLFVGTKKQAQESIAEQATRVGMPYVNQRWLGGMLTNFQTVFKRLQRMKELEAREQAGWEGVATKKEQLMLTREMAKLNRSLGGIREMTKVPSAVWIVDTKKEHIAVGEARKLGIPVVAILDTNCDPDEVDYKIPGNDDAIRSAALLTRVVADAVAEGLVARAADAANAGRDEKPEATGAVAPTSRCPSGSGAAQDRRRRPLLRPPTPLRPRPPPLPAEAPAAEAPAPAAAARPRPPRRRRRSDRGPGRRAPPPAHAGRPAPTPRSRRPTTTRDRHSRRTDRERHGELLRRRCEEAPRRHRRRDDGVQEGPGRGRRRLRRAPSRSCGSRARRRAAKRGDRRSATNGLVAAAEGAMIELASETDFVAKSEQFQTAGQRHRGPLRGVVGHRRRVAARPRRSRTARPSTRTSRTSPPSSARSSSCAARSSSTAQVATYLHRKASDLPPQVGVLVQFTGGDAEAARGAAMQVAAMRAALPHPRGGPGRRRRGRAPRRSRRRPAPRASPSGHRQDRRGPPERLLRRQRPARAGVGAARPRRPSSRCSTRPA